MTSGPHHFKSPRGCESTEKMTTTAQEKDVCHLLNLPAELRNRIYEAVLSPGVLCLTRTDTKRFAVTPTVSPLFLATCRQIYHEASKLLYFDNEVTLIMDVHDTFAPVINESRLPQPALENLEHVCLVCDGTANLQASYDDIDFTPLSALVSLKTLRLCMVFSSTPRDSIEMLSGIVTEVTAQILVRIPAATQLLYSLEAGSLQEALVEYVRAKGAERHTRGSAGRSFTAMTGNAGGSFARKVSVIPSDMVRESVKSVEAEHGYRGNESGAKPGTFDVFADHRAEPKGFAWRS